MSVIMGKNGSVRIGATKLTYIDSFTLNLGADLVEITNYGSSGYKQRVAALKDWSGSFTASLDRTDTGQDAIISQFEGTGSPSTIALRFYTSSRAYWSGNALISGTPVTSNVNSKVGMTINFQGSGAISFST